MDCSLPGSSVHGILQVSQGTWGTSGHGELGEGPKWTQTLKARKRAMEHTTPGKGPTRVPEGGQKGKGARFKPDSSLVVAMAALTSASRR